MNSGSIRKTCPISGLEIVETASWSNLKLADNYVISFRKIGDHIVDVHGYGSMMEFDVKRFCGFLERFIDDQSIKMPFVEMRNYEDVTGIVPSKETIQAQKDYFIENKDKHIGFVAYNASKVIGILLKSGQRQYKKVNVAIATENSYDAAIKSALLILNNKSPSANKKREKKFHRIPKEDIENVALFCGHFLWEKNDMFDLDDITIQASSPLYPIVENLVIVREELLNLEADSVKKSNALELEKQQTGKIVESLQSGILIVDENKNRIVDINPAACLLLKGEKESLIGKDFKQFVSDHHLHNQMRRYQKNEVKESEVVTLDGQVVPVLRSTVRIKLNGKDYMLENFVDISDAKEHEDKLKKSLAHTKQLNNLTFNREKRIIEMKCEVNDLLMELGRPPKYKSVITMKNNRGEND